MIDSACAISKGIAAKVVKEISAGPVPLRPADGAAEPN
jgi:hypothetical protein